MRGGAVHRHYLLGFREPARMMREQIVDALVHTGGNRSVSRKQHEVRQLAYELERSRAYAQR
jgi:hypothetical protein